MGDNGATPASVRVVRSLADAQGMDPSELTFRLGDVIDTDALDAMAAHDGNGWELSFEVEDHEVRVVPGEPIVVDGTEYH
ncbi:hypothetical protein L593_11415 [Salinarchaeum sp. Harcht-Bsk1]|uniref:HalOD1 output domain-containing protein n=1 Tax=Salinarchaeum sp. Harcht-Bsk1 TaxID=1333523 RepID=UPI0003423C19|nr:HalOD1 output domain-containing protein [Salinarchaeum sp. Harcht-Bsk1]AGN02228.1 hypothetical protein L593_11415 [Salinarchaeum sp. Harcht-Bsk1]